LCTTGTEGIKRKEMSYTRQEFVEKYGGYISKSVKGTGILQGTVIAQAIIESQGMVSDGSYKVGASKLSRNSNNYFGIKCHNWKGKSYNIDTGEYDSSGKSYTHTNACFRSYDSVEDSIKDYVSFLKNNPRYEKAGVFKAKTVKQQAEALKTAGYATAPDYPSKIQSVYNGVKEYADKFSEYGITGIAKSFANNPIAFIKRNKEVVAGAILMSTALGIGIYYMVKKK
jgi:flagellum-specific peptidoglycan hydrolase FlgJ